MTEPREGAPTSGAPGGDGAPSVTTWQPSGSVPSTCCPFLASIDLDDRVRQARLVPDTANRCLSSGEPIALSAHDQKALCLTAEHPACVRFVRASRRVREPEPEPELAPARAPAARRAISTPIVAAIVILVFAAVAAGTSLAVNGDLAVGTSPGSATPRPAAPSATTAPAVSPGAVVALPASTPTSALPTSAPPVPSATPVPSASPIPTAAVAAVTSAPATPTPRPRRYPGLTLCADAPDCYIYVVKSGDTLGAIAGRYGFTLDEVLERNPSIRDPGLIVRGQEIRLPTPKR